MSSASANTDRSARAENAGMEPQIDFLFRSEMFWAPARAAATLMLHAHRNATAMMQINRKLADELRDIVRREQDVMCDVSQRLFSRVTSGTAQSEQEGSPEPLGQLYETAVASMREFNEAVAEAHTRSFAALRQHAQATADVSQNAATDVTHAVEDEAA